MSSPQSISHWIQQLKEGEQAGIQALWDRYFARLVELARQRLRGTPRRAADEEDVALSAFDTFCRRAAEGSFPRLADRDDLWQILVMLTLRKAVNLVDHEGRQKRGGGVSEDAAALNELVSREPDPAFAAQVAENCQRLLGALADSTLRDLAVAKMEGASNQEVADRLGVSLPTVERKLRRIRTIWENRSGEKIVNS
jgi:DNA-directed RNA polymerase specialized sigma24 family protein